MLPLLGNNCEFALSVNNILAQYDKLHISSSVHCDKNMSALCQLYDAEVTRPLSAKQDFPILHRQWVVLIRED